MAATKKKNPAKKTEIKKTSKKVKKVSEDKKVNKAHKINEKTKSVSSSKKNNNEVRTWKIISGVLALVILVLIGTISYIIVDNTQTNNNIPSENMNANSSTENTNNLNNKDNTNTATKTELEGIELTIIEDPSCTNCDVDTFVDNVKTNLFPKLTAKKISIETEEGKKIADELKIEFVPVYLFNTEVEKFENWTQLQGAFIEVEVSNVKYYMLNPQYVQAKMPLNDLKIMDNVAIMGDLNAPVTIYEFSDYECPFCGIAEGSPEILEQFSAGKEYTAPMPEIRKNYVETGKVKIVFYNMPLEQLHPKVRTVHLAALCAKEQNKWEEFHHLIWNKRASWTTTPDYVETMEGYAKDLGLDTTKFNDCLESKKYNDQIERELAYGSKMGVSGTPAFFVEKSFLNGAQDYKTFKTLIEAELAKVN